MAVLHHLFDVVFDASWSYPVFWSTFDDTEMGVSPQ